MEPQIPSTAQKQVTQPKPPGVEDDTQSRLVGILKINITFHSPTTGLLWLQASSASAPTILAIRQSLARTLGPALIIMNTAGRGDELLLGLQLENEQQLDQLLEKAAIRLPDVTLYRLPTPAADPFAWVSKLPQIPRVGD